MKKVKSLHAKSQELLNKTHDPIKNSQPEPKLPPMTVQPEDTISKSISTLISSLTNLENNVVDQISGVIDSKLSEKLDEKLDGMDEVVVELIRCKTENETLRQKINELNKENYNLKNQVNSFKKVAPGLYIKRSNDNFML